MGDRIAVTIVGGYLGSGKTTLVNRILAGADERVAVVVNDFGEINVDESLIASVEGDTITLANGCICCSMVDGLAAALADLQEVDPRPERLVIEASGVADPGGVGGYCHGPGYRLDLVLVMVDAEQAATQAADVYVGETVRGQIRSADLLILNKTDLIGTARAAEVTAQLGEWSQAPVAAAVGADVDLGLVLDRLHQPGSSEPHLHDHHDEVFEAWSHRSSVPLHRPRFEAMVAALPRSVMRAKGVVAFEGSHDRWVFQKVGPRHTLAREGAWGGSPTSEVVLIGLRGSVPPGWLSEQLEA